MQLLSHRPASLLFIKIVAILSLLLSCHAKPGTKDDLPIINGEELKEDSIDSKSLVMLVAPGSESMPQQICTATIISPADLLTAGHCVTDRAIENPKLVRAFSGVSPFKNKNRTRLDIAKIIRHPDYKKSNSQNNDLAILHLKSVLPSNLRIMKLITEEKYLPKNNADISIFGYGIFDDRSLNTDSVENGAGVLRVGKVRLIGEPESDFEKGFIFSQENKAGACFGDSGGPATVVNESGQRIIVGVGSAVFDSETEPSRAENNVCAKKSYYISIYEYKDWILDTIESKGLLIQND